jgi:hypothetical protein
MRSPSIAERVEALEKEAKVNKSALDVGLVDTHREMVEAIKEQTASILAGEIAAQKRHDEEMEKKQGLKEQNVWVNASNAALCCPGVSVGDAMLCGDNMLDGFKKRFGN